MSTEHHTGSEPAFAAIDLGATSGRVIVGHILADSSGPKLHTQQIRRFANTPVRTRDGLHWNLLHLYHEALLGLAEAERLYPEEIVSIGIDSWAVDYGLLRDDRLLGSPYHYRDERNIAGVTSVHALLSPEELYQHNGLQYLSFNSLYQLASEGELLSLADQILLIPDLLGFWFTGAKVAERTNASTTGLVDARTGQWNQALLATLSIPQALLPELVGSGTTLGTLTDEAARVVGREIRVVSVASHDTASAVAAVPATTHEFAYISCGTWGLVGLELDSPILTEAARLANFTNEGGIAGTTRFLHNVMGTWLFSESLRHWEPNATESKRTQLLSALLTEAAHTTETVSVFDANDPVFMAPGDIPARITAWCEAHGIPAPTSRLAVILSITESLAQAFADAVTKASQLATKQVSVIHIVGGGSQNSLLCQRLADISGREVLAGPVEATAIGNLLVQAQAHGLIEPGLNQLRDVVARSAEIIRFIPASSEVP